MVSALSFVLSVILVVFVGCFRWWVLWVYCFWVLRTCDFDLVFGNGFVLLLFWGFSLF